jgi:hypothetical protein
LKDQGEREKRRKKKRHEEKAPVITMREKSTIKKVKVPRVLKIHTSSDSGETHVLKENLALEKEVLVEKDQIASAEGNDASRPKENLLPEKEPVVEEDQNADAGGRQDDGQKDNTTLVGDAPNTDKKTDSPTLSTKNGNEVILISSLSLIFSSNS